MKLALEDVGFKSIGDIAKAEVNVCQSVSNVVAKLTAKWVDAASLRKFVECFPDCVTSLFHLEYVVS